MSGQKMGSISVQNVTKIYPHTDGTEDLLALEQVSFDVHMGDFTCIVGESGCGKTTLLRMIAGLETPTAGEIQIDGMTVTAPDPKCGMVFQHNILFPWLTVRNNVAFGPKRLGRYKGNEQAVEKLLETVRIREFANAYPGQLSGGMQQRVALARALANQPDVLLLDEPLSALDAFTRMKLQDELLRIWRLQKNTMLMITHDIDEAIYLSNQVIVMTPRPGSIKKIIPIDLPYPRNRSSEAFVAIRNAILELLHYAGENSEVTHENA